MKAKVLFGALCLLLMMSACTGDNKVPATQEGSEEATQEVSEENVCMSAEEMPEYPGGMPAMMAFIQENIQYPEEAKEAQIEGRVFCTFIIDKSGKVTEVKVAKSSGTQCLDDEAVRVVSLMPDWKPGMNEGEPVSVIYTIPISFLLN